MIRLAPALSILAFCASAPAAAQAARDFQLPPAATPTPDTRVQGPVDADAPVLVRPRAIETARPIPAPTAPVSTPTSAPAIAVPQPSPARAVRTTDAPPPAPRNSAETTSRSETPPLAPPSPGAPLVLPPTTPPPVVNASQPAADGPPFAWLSIALGAIVLAALAAFFAWRRRTAQAATPTIERPFVPPAMNEPGAMLAIAVEAIRMDRSVLNATVGYRVTIRNRTTQALTQVAVEADLVSASRERPADQQLASPGVALTPRHTADRLAPGQSLRFEGQVRLPLAEAGAIWQGSVGLLVPLLRVRATAAEGVPVATTLVIGRAEGAAARPQPFRLDEPPRSYAPLAQRVLDAVPARA